MISGLQSLQCLVPVMSIDHTGINSNKELVLHRTGKARESWKYGKQ